MKSTIHQFNQVSTNDTNVTYFSIVQRFNMANIWEEVVMVIVNYLFPRKPLFSSVLSFGVKHISKVFNCHEERFCMWGKHILHDVLHSITEGAGIQIPYSTKLRIVSHLDHWGLRYSWESKVRWANTCIVLCFNPFVTVVSNSFECVSSKGGTV